MKNVVKSLSGVVCLLFALSGCSMFSPTFTYTSEMREVREKALAGDVESMRQMATYHWCMSDSRNRREACRWLEQAGNSGDAMSSELAGWCYLIGRGVEKDKDAAARYFEQAADQYWMWWSLTLAGCVLESDFDDLWDMLNNEWSSQVDLNNLMSDLEVYKIIDNFNRAIYLGSRTADYKKQGMLARYSDLSFKLDRYLAKIDHVQFERYLSEKYFDRIEEPSGNEDCSCGAVVPIGYRIIVEGDYSYCKGTRDVWLCRFSKGNCSSGDQILKLARTISGLEISPNPECVMPIPLDVRLPNQYLQLIGIDNEQGESENDESWSTVVMPVYAEECDSAISEYYSTFARSDYRRALLCVLRYSLLKLSHEKGSESCRDILPKVIAVADLISGEKNFISSVIDEGTRDE